jgi:hypothetical protein
MIDPPPGAVRQHQHDVGVLNLGGQGRLEAVIAAEPERAVGLNGEVGPGEMRRRIESMSQGSVNVVIAVAVTDEKLLVPRTPAMIQHRHLPTQTWIRRHRHWPLPGPIQKKSTPHFRTAQ